MMSKTSHLVAAASLCAMALSGCNRASLVLRDAQTQQPVAQARVFIYTGKADVPFNTRAATDSHGVARFTHPSSVGTLFATVHPQDQGASSWGQFNPGHGEWQRLYQREAPQGLSGIEGRLESPVAEARP